MKIFYPPSPSDLLGILELPNFSYLLKNPIVNSVKLNKNIFWKKKNKFTDDVLRIAITSKTRNILTLFALKDKNNYKSRIIYKRTCSCGSPYIVETKCNAEVRWNEHNNPTKNSSLSKHLQNNINHCFTWTNI